jgi:hypothetical protein
MRRKTVSARSSGRSRQLKQLLELKERGALSDQEFNREKQKILLQ